MNLSMKYNDILLPVLGGKLSVTQLHTATSEQNFLILAVVGHYSSFIYFDSSRTKAICINLTNQSSHQ